MYISVAVKGDPNYLTLNSILLNTKKEKLVLLTDNQISLKTAWLIDSERVKILNLKNVIEKIGEKFGFFRFLKGYGKLRAVQFLLSTNKGVILRDNDTIELGPEALWFQKRYINKRVEDLLKNITNETIVLHEEVKSCKLVYIFGEYIGRKLNLIGNSNITKKVYSYYPSWYRRHNKDLDSLIRGYQFEIKPKIVVGNLESGRAGNCIVSRKICETLPPFDGWVRGNDDTVIVKIISLLQQKYKITACYNSNIYVFHQLEKSKIEDKEILKRFKIIYNSALFDFFRNEIFYCVKMLLREKVSFKKFSYKLSNVLCERKEIIIRNFTNYYKNVNNKFGKVFIEISKLLNTRNTYQNYYANEVFTPKEEIIKYYNNTIELLKNWRKIFRLYHVTVKKMVNGSKL